MGALGDLLHGGRPRVSDAQVQELVRRDRLDDLRSRRRIAYVTISIMTLLGTSLCLAAMAVSPIWFVHVLLCVAGIRWHQKLLGEVRAEIAELSSVPRAQLVSPDDSIVR